MGFRERATNALVRRAYRRAARALMTQTPERICRHGEAKLLRAFRRAASEVPAYRALLAAAGVTPGGITSLEAFQRQVPVLDKGSVFGRHELKKLCVPGSFEQAASFHSSSGHSGVFSYGMETRAGLAGSALGLEFLLDLHFGALERKTLLANCLPMGVKVSTRTVPVADTSVRPDVILALLRELRDEFEQFILVGESPFLKHLLEEGPANGVQWRDLRVHIVTGGEYIAENMRRYFAHLLGHDLSDPSRGTMLINMGLSELSLSILMESFETARVRRAALQSDELRASLTGQTRGACPVVMQWFPDQVYLESADDGNGRPELLVSLASPRAPVPLMRYNTQDVVQTLGYRELEQRLRATGHEALLPRSRLPLALVWGKRQSVDLGEGERLSPDEVKEALYRDFDIAGAVTGNFRLAGDGHEGTLQVQLRECGGAPADLEQRLAGYLSDYTRAPVALRPLPYREFPYGFAHDYERKNRYV